MLHSEGCITVLDFWTSLGAFLCGCTIHATVLVSYVYKKEYMCKVLCVSVCTNEWMCVTYLCMCVCVPGFRVQPGVGGPGAREAVVIVEAGWRAEDSIAALGRLSAVGRAALICHEHRQTPLSTSKTLTWLSTCEATPGLMFCNC